MNEMNYYNISESESKSVWNEGKLKNFVVKEKSTVLAKNFPIKSKCAARIYSLYKWNVSQFSVLYPNRNFLKRYNFVSLNYGAEKGEREREHIGVICEETEKVGRK